MSSQFKNRLVGVIILVACVVIFLPSIIDGKKKVYEDEFSTTPIKPETKPHSQDISLITDDKSEPEQWSVEEVPEAPITEKKKITTVIKNNTVEKTAPKEQIKKSNDPAWTIQLGAFKNAKNINVLLKKLNKAGFQTHTVPMEVIDGQLTRVFVGPDVSKERLEKQLPQLKRLTNLDGKLLSFDPINP